jgi:hypothetical protein
MLNSYSEYYSFFNVSATMYCDTDKKSNHTTVEKRKLIAAINVYHVFCFAFICSIHSAAM